MATAPLPRTEIVDLRQVRSQQLAPLFAEEEKAWREELRWDYAPSARLIRKHIDTRSLFGYVAFQNGIAAGYCFFIYEETTRTGSLTPWTHPSAVRLPLTVPSDPFGGSTVAHRPERKSRDKLRVALTVRLSLTVPSESRGRNSKGDSRGTELRVPRATVEGQKGLLGDLFVREAYRPPPREPGLAPPAAGLATQLLERALQTLETTPGLTRIEAQFMPFGIESLAPVFQAHTFRTYPRLFMYLDLKQSSAAPPGRSLGARCEKEGWLIERWQERFLEPLAELIVSAYAGHVDSNINDQYGSRTGALKFLKNIVIFPGCGVFRPEASFVAFAGPGGRGHRVEPGMGNAELVGALLISQVAPGVAHVTQVCVRRELQGQGLGTQLLMEMLEALRERSYEGVSLSVTAENRRAADLYRRFGFAVLKEFAAYVWEKP